MISKFNSLNNTGHFDPFYVSVLFCFMHSRVKKAKLSMVLLSAVDSVPLGSPHDVVWFAGTVCDA